jgi:prepilin-type N-terminal cleavage/methylation domain-containing protein
MTVMHLSQNRGKGFSLLEILLAMIVSSILGTILYSYMNTVLLHPPHAPSQLQRLYDLQTVMENISAHYDEIRGKSTYPKWNPGHAYAAGDTVVSRAASFGHRYVCISGGSSGSSEPLWPTVSGAEIADGTVTWKENGGELDELFDKVSASVSGSPPSPDDVWNYEYGRYGILAKKFIRFDSGTETAVLPGQPENLLKISIKNEDGYRLTSLFSTSY